jgi:hydrogenase maturation factor
MLGLNPLYVASEGKLIAVVAPEDAGQALSLMREHPLGRNAAIIGTVVDERGCPQRMVFSGRPASVRGQNLDRLSGPRA